MKKFISTLALVSTVLTSSLLADTFQYSNNAHVYKDHVGNVNAAGYVNRISSNLADQLTQNKDFTDTKNTPLAIMSVVALEDFKKTAPIAKRISENLIHEMHVRGYKVVDYKAMSKIEIDKNGDYLFSRAIKDLKNQRFLNYALSGTYVEYKDGMVVNCRIIDIKTSVILSTAQIFIPKKILKDVDKMYVKNTWFNKNSRQAMTKVSIQKR